MLMCTGLFFSFFFFNDTATTEIYTLALHDALPICGSNLGCNPAAASLPTDASVQALVAANDTCSTAALSVSHSDTTSGCVTTRTFTIRATDACGNSTTAPNAVYTWTTDTTGPVITASPSGSNLGCNPAAASLPTDASVQALVAANDTCSTAALSVSHSDTTSGCVTTRTFTIRATDACGNSTTAPNAVYTWTTDTSGPTITASPSGSNLGCNPAAASLPTDASVQALVAANDTCSTAALSVSHSDTTSGCVTTRTFTIRATDACGNSTTAPNAVYTWTTDTSGPTITASPSGSNLGCNPAAASLPTDASVQALVAANDTCSTAALSVSHSDTTSGCVTTRTFTIRATDACGNSTTAPNAVYTWTTDTSGPTITASPSGSNLGCNPAAASLPTDASVQALVAANDTCSTAALSVSHSDTTSGCVTTRTFTIRATDACGNSTTAPNAVYTWTTDTTGPVITASPSGSNLGCNPAAASLPTDASVQGLVSATDNCTGSPTLSVTHSDTTSGCVTTRTFTIRATDACGNSTTAPNAVYTWTTDTSGPTITASPSGSNLGCNPAAASLPTDASVQALVAANDTCSTAALSVSHSDTTSGCVTTRTFTIRATDACGNSTTAPNAVYTWTTDTTGPVITASPSGSNLGCNPAAASLPSDASVQGLVSATDNCSGSLTLSVSHSDTTSGCVT